VRLNGTGAPTDPSAGTVEQTYARAKQAFAAGALADAESLCCTVVGELLAVQEEWLPQLDRRTLD